MTCMMSKSKTAFYKAVHQRFGVAVVVFLGRLGRG